MWTQRGGRTHGSLGSSATGSRPRAGTSPISSPEREMQQPTTAHGPLLPTHLVVRGAVSGGTTAEARGRNVAPHGRLSKSDSGAESSSTRRTRIYGGTADSHAQKTAWTASGGGQSWCINATGGTRHRRPPGCMWWVRPRSLRSHQPERLLMSWSGFDATATNFQNFQSVGGTLRRRTLPRGLLPSPPQPVTQGEASETPSHPA